MRKSKKRERPQGRPRVAYHEAPCLSGSHLEARPLVVGTRRASGPCPCARRGGAKERVLPQAATAPPPVGSRRGKRRDPVKDCPTRCVAGPTTNDLGACRVTFPTDPAPVLAAVAEAFEFCWRQVRPFLLSMRISGQFVDLSQKPHLYVFQIRFLILQIAVGCFKFPPPVSGL